MKLKFRDYEVPIPVATFAIVFLNLLVVCYSTILSAREIPEELEQELNSLEESWNTDCRAIAESLARDPNITSQAQFYQLYEEKIKEAATDYRKRALPLLERIPIFRFFRTWGASPEIFSQGVDESEETEGIGVKKFLWFCFTLFTSQYVHGDLSHFFWNMVFLTLFGLTIENETGSRKFLLFYHLVWCN